MLKWSNMPDPSTYLGERASVPSGSEKWLVYDSSAVTNVVKDWYNYSSSNNGFILKYRTCVNDYNTFYSSDYRPGGSTAYIPYLSVSYVDTIPVSQICLSTTQMSLDVDDSKSINVTVVPSNATNKGYTATSSDIVQLEKTSNGYTINALRQGEATITITSASNTNIKAVLHVVVSKYKIISNINTYEALDTTIDAAREKSEKRYKSEPPTTEARKLELGSMHDRARITALGGYYINMQNASTLLDYFLDNVGVMITDFNVKVFIEKNNTTIEHRKTNLNDFMTSAEILLQSNGSINIGSKKAFAASTSPEEYPADPDRMENDSWYAIGSSNGWINAQVTKSGSSYSAHVRYYVHDFYDWEEGSTKRGGFVEDGEMAQLHAAGYAKEFEILGVHEIQLTWNQGQRIDTGATFTDWS